MMPDHQRFVTGGSGFLYYVSVAGVTGTKAAAATDIELQQ